MLVNMMYRLKQRYPDVSRKALSDIIISYYKFTPKRNGLNKHRRKRKVIVSLTSIPSRIETTWITLESILRQNYKPDKIILWLGKDQFQNVKLPDALVKQQSRGVEIRFCEDIGPYTKVIYTLAEYPENVIISVDDDVIYAESMVRFLVESYVRNPKCICAHRTHWIEMRNDGTPIKYNNWTEYAKRKDVGNRKKEICNKRNFLTGVGGVLYPPHSLYKDVLKKELFLKLSPKADDVWLYMMAIMNQTNIINVKGIFGNLQYIVDEENSVQKTALLKENVLGGRNDEYLKNILDYYELNLKNVINDCDK